MNIFKKFKRDNASLAEAGLDDKTANGGRHDEILDQTVRIIRTHGHDVSKNAVEILRAFLHTPQHVTKREIKEILDKKEIAVDDKDIGDVMSLALEYGIARKHEFENDDPRFEHLHPEEHHDHMICVKCGHIEEFEDTELEAMPHRIAAEKDFALLRHRFELYGLCHNCRGEVASLMPLNMAETGARVKVEKFVGGGNFQRRIQDMGLQVGQTVTVLRAGGDGPCVVAAGEARIGIGAGMAKKIMVKIQEEANPNNGKS